MPLSSFSKLFRPFRRPCGYVMGNYPRVTCEEKSWPHPVIEALVRNHKGKKKVRTLRKLGLVPCQIIVSNANPDSVIFSIPIDQAEKLIGTFGFSSARHILNIRDKYGNLRTYDVVPNTVDFHPLTEKPFDIRFSLLKDDVPVKITFPIHFENVGFCKGIRAQKGFMKILNDKIKCLWVGKVNELPRFFRISVKHLEVGQGIDISDINFPEGLTPLYKTKYPMKICKILKETNVSEKESIENANESAKVISPDSKKEGKSKTLKKESKVVKRGK